ncbi:SF II RNA helicase [Cryptosporidium bovis]|uniref:SF II RNA helicase n=1 Tax=Cryptosporidium bovis TaxID=310047 RepID=UPI00351A0BF0|nr:SF II RNA helicase [Cryptosporidium bovis]
MIDTIKKIKKVGNKDNGKWVQSSLKNFVHESGENKNKVNENEDYYNSEDERMTKIKEIEENIRMERMEEFNLNELFEKYRLKICKIREKSKNCTQDIIAYRDEIVNALKWCLNEIRIPGYRVGQEEVIHKLVCDRKDVVLILPTGGGKSLTYQLPSLLREYQKKVKEIPPLSKGMVTVVVSPLIALIEDQINSLKKWGIKSNGLSMAIVQKNDGNISANKALEELYVDLSRKTPQNGIIYITPESFGTEKVLNCLYNLYLNNNLFCFAIDEAHCISEWGHDFRVAYRRLGNIKSMFSDIPILACTATASPKVQKDILNVLKLVDPYISINSFNRPNIHYTVYNIDNNDYLSSLSQEEIILNSVLYMNEYFSKLNKGNEFNSASENANKKVSNKIMGIVYVNKRKSSEILSKYLNDNGVTSKCYHAGLSLKLRTEIQNDWLDDKIQVLVGTIAFGMGVHKSNVRFVIHSSIPDSIDSYYQQSGRAGRDSEYSRAMLFYSKKDIQTLNCIKRKSLQYLYLRSEEKANQSYEKYQDNLNSVIEFARCNNRLEDTNYYESIDCNNENNNKTQNPINYQLNLNKYGECRRKNLLGYFGEKYYTDKNKSDYNCCDVCDSKYNKERLEYSFLNYISINNVVNNKYENNSYYNNKTNDKFDYKYEYDNYNNNNENKSCYDNFTTAKSIMIKKNSSNTKFVSALTFNDKLKKQGISYLDRLKILEEEENKMEINENSQDDGIDNSSAGIFKAIKNSMGKKRPLI